MQITQKVNRNNDLLAFGMFFWHTCATMTAGKNHPKKNFQLFASEKAEDRAKLFMSLAMLIIVPLVVVLLDHKVHAR